MQSARTPDEPRFTGRHMLLIMVAFFGVIISVNVGMAVVASTSWTGLVVKNSYVASQEFETRRTAHETQLAAGWQSSFNLAGGRAELRLVDGAGLPVELGAATLKVNRPVGGHDDQVLALQRLDDGLYVADLALPPGVWEVLIEAPETALGPYTLHQRLSLGGDGQ